ncbi:MAG: twin-arginine translocation signal domain-containing protein, partial [Phycisphaerae bacterium]|nr:twin-arginine translocation signal domain-containing protein [Phycisphaerae bacterium]
MFQCQPHRCCHGCCHPVDRRHFLKGCGAAVVAAAGSLTSFAARAAEKDHTRARIAAVFLMSMNTREIWPYPGFDTKGRQREVLSRLRKGCPKIEFVPVTVENPADMQKLTALDSTVDGYLVYTMTLDWNHRAQVVNIAALGKPTVVADEFLGGSGVFLTAYGELYDRKVPVVAVSTTRLTDLVPVVQQFVNVRKRGATLARFAQHCEQIYRTSFQAEGRLKCVDDPVPLTDINKCVERLRRSSFLIIGRGQAGQEHDFLGVKGRYIDFDELQSNYEKIDPQEAAEWANRWSKQADDLPPADYVEPSRPTPDAIQKAGGVYLAMLELLKKYGTDSVTMNCLGGFAAGKLP